MRWRRVTAPPHGEREATAPPLRARAARGGATPKLPDAARYRCAPVRRHNRLSSRSAWPVLPLSVLLLETWRS
eukprot:7382840-Prymnesium_polylepis.2